MTPLDRTTPTLGRRSVLGWAGVALLGLSLEGCGGGGSSGGPTVTMQGSLDIRSISSNINGNTYPLNIYLPPASAGPRSSLPVNSCSLNGGGQGAFLDFVRRELTPYIEANVSFVQTLAGRHYAGLNLQQQACNGNHTGIIPAAFADAITFAIG